MMFIIERDPPRKKNIFKQGLYLPIWTESSKSSFKQQDPYIGFETLKTRNAR